MTASTLRLPWYNPSRFRLTARKLADLPILPVSILLIVLVIPALFAEWIAPYDPLAAKLSIRLAPPAWMEGGSWDHILGTDKQGRDVLSRIIYGARISASISMVVVILTTTFGVSLGLIAGYFGGIVDAVIMRIIDGFYAIPFIMAALVIVAALGPGYGTMLFIASLGAWIGDCRQVRGLTLARKELDYIARARVASASSIRIMFRHILPNVMDIVIVLATLQVGATILLEATLSFLGVGIPRPTPS